jgi:hypothetical protein
MTPNTTVFEVVSLLPNEERSVQVGVEEHIWDGAFAAGVVLPALCHQGRCLTCAGRLETTGEVDQSDSANYYPEASFCFAPGSHGRLYESGLTSRVRCERIEFRKGFCPLFVGGVFGNRNVEEALHVTRGRTF